MRDSERKRRLEEIRKTINELHSEEGELLRGCVHKIKKVHVTGNCFSAACSICNKDFDWWCSKSPDNLCHYFTDSDGTVTLNNGKKVRPPKHDIHYETSDCCLYCGNPEERK